MGRGTGVVIGILFGWVAGVALNHGGGRLMQYRAMMADDSAKSLPWIALVVIAAAVLALLLGSNQAYGAGALVGAGLLFSATSAAVLLLPVRTAFDVAKLFEVPGEPARGAALWDGSMLFVGIVLLVLGMRRWGSAAPARNAVGPYGGPNPVPTQFGGPSAR